jgi:hypothetical protein
MRNAHPGADVVECREHGNFVKNRRRYDQEY